MTDRRDDALALLPLPLATFHILLSLADEDRHGYGIILEAAERTRGEVRLSAGTLYRSIQRMLEDGLLVEVLDRPPARRAAPGGFRAASGSFRAASGSFREDERRRYYRITPFGRSVARAEGRRLSELVKLARAAGFAPERP